MFSELEKEEKYDYARDRPGEVTVEQFEKIVEERQQRILMDRMRERNNKRLQNMKDFLNYLEDERQKVQEDFETIATKWQKIQDREEKLKFNFEVIVYLKQGQNEVPQLPVATDYKDAILINTSVVEDENNEIEMRGQKKVRNMEAILTHKTTLKIAQYEKEELTYQIEDFTERAKDVQLYRVTKQTQEIIQGKHQKKDEEDKKRLEGQIKQLESNTANRISNIHDNQKKLRREIKEKQQENEQLEAKARQLQQNVDQRKEIMGLKQNTNQDSESDPSKRIKEIANRRRLLDVIKQQEEEIMFLKDELDRLRARTFPSFAHLNKAEYPDGR